jgi:hypothetical protein
MVKPDEALVVRSGGHVARIPIEGDLPEPATGALKAHLMRHWDGEDLAVRIEGRPTDRLRGMVNDVVGDVSRLHASDDGADDDEEEASDDDLEESIDLEVDDEVTVHGTFEPSFAHRDEAGDGVMVGIWATDDEFVLLHLQGASEIDDRRSSIRVDATFDHPDAGWWGDRLVLVHPNVLVEVHEDSDGFPTFVLEPAPDHADGVTQCIARFLDELSGWDSEGHVLTLLALGLPFDEGIEFHVGMLPRNDDPFATASVSIAAPSGVLEALRAQTVTDEQRADLRASLVAFEQSEFGSSLDDLDPMWRRLLVSLESS